MFSKRHVLSLELACLGTARAFARAYHVAGNLLLGPVVFEAVNLPLMNQALKGS